MYGVVWQFMQGNVQKTLGFSRKDCVVFFKFSFNRLISVWISSVLEQMSTLTRIQRFNTDQKKTLSLHFKAFSFSQKSLNSWFDFDILGRAQKKVCVLQNSQTFFLAMPLLQFFNRLTVLKQRQHKLLQSCMRTCSRL